MLPHLKKHWMTWATSFAALIFCWVAISSDPFQQCMEKSYSESADHEPAKGISQIYSTLGWYRTCSAEFIIKDGEAITAFFTLVLSISTIALWLSNNKAVEAAKAAAEALPNVERAYVFMVPDLEWHLQTQHSSGVGTYHARAAAHFRLENHGKTPAIIESIDARLGILREEPDNRLHLTMNIIPGEKILDSGKSWWPQDHPLIVEISEAEADAIAQHQAAVWFYGSVIYWDMFGKGHITRFRWSYSEILEIFTPRGEAPYNERT
jgi:hypothetical protein